MTEARPETATSTWFAGLLLWAGLLGVPTFGVARWLAGPPETAFQIGVRVGFTALAAGFLLGSQRPGGDVWLVRGASVLTFSLQAWYQCNGPWEARAQTALLVTSLATLSFTTVRQMVALWVWTSAFMVAGHLAIEGLHAQLPASFVSNTLTAAVVGTATWYLRRLEGQLVAERRQLEDRVDDRTKELADTVERLQREVAVRRSAEDTALRANLAKSVFLANMSHELRTPLNAILGYTELLLEDAVDHQADLGRIQTSGRHLLRMIEDVLDLAKIDSGRLDIAWQPIEVQDVLARSVAIVQPLARARDLELRVEMPAEPIMLRADPDRLVQILVNLLSNAVKFTRPGGRVGARVVGREREVVFDVSDTGTGIPADRLTNIFDRFVQADESATRRIGGTGLGLAICKELSTLMGAELTVESTVAVGSRFAVTFRR